jgi:diacylglycerol kinase family enzyme
VPRIFDPETTLVLRNPVSGRRGARRRADQLDRFLAGRGYAIGRTKGPGAAARIAKRFGEEHPDAALIVVGGDGSLFDAIRDLPVRVPLAFFPTGTVNLLARSLGIPRDPVAWLGMLDREELRDAYFSRCNGRPFASVGSVGLDAETIEQTDERLKLAFQEIAIGAKAFQLYWTHRVPEYRVTLDGARIELPLVGIIFGAQPYYAGPNRILPEADHGQRDLDVLLLTGRRRRVFWKYAAGVFTGRLSRWRGVVHRKVTTLRIETDPPMPVELDGDHFGRTPVEIEVEKHPRRVLAPEDSSARRTAKDSRMDGEKSSCSPG